MCFDRIIDNLRVGTFPTRSPDGQSEFTRTLQNSVCFSACPLRVSHMQEGKVGDHPIENPILKRKVLSVALFKTNIRKHFPRDPNHLLRKINPDWNGTAFGRRSGDVPRTTTNIQ